MFDDVGGLGAWHRRWCVLSCGALHAWTYPNDEKIKAPLTKVEMKNVVSSNIRTVERIYCARPNTFEFITYRKKRSGDKENLITTNDNNDYVKTKHWLAADTKDERISWISSLNQALIDVRAWDKNALKPNV